MPEAPLDFEGRSVLITGGARGIGLATARLFLARGANVTIGALRSESAERAAEGLAAEGLGAGSRLATVVADVGTVQGCRATVRAAEDAFGGIDVLFANAGGYASEPIEEASERLFDEMLNVHVKGFFFCVQAALGSLRRSRGVAVAMASDAGLQGLRGGWSAYCAAMGAVVNLARQLAVDLAPEVRVNAVAAGPVGTEHLFEDLRADSYGGIEAGDDPVAAMESTIPLHRITDPEEIARAVLFIAGSPTMTGSVVSIDGGNTAGLP